MKNNKIASAFIVSIFAIAGVGVSFAGLSDTITVFGSIDTATVEMDIYGYSGTWVFKVYGEIIEDPLGHPYLWDLNNEILIYQGSESNYPGEQAVIDWAATNGGTAMLVSWAQGRDWIPGETTTPYDAVVEFYNLFPCINFHADIDFQYIGTIPAKITSVDMNFIGVEIILPTGENGDWLEYLQGTGDFTYHFDQSVTPVQVHLDDHAYFTADLHIPQDNRFQGLSGTGYLTINLQQWNDECDGILPGKTIIIPTPEQYMTAQFYHWGPQSYWRTHLTNVPVNLNPPGSWSPPITEGADCVGWCISESTYITPGQPYSVRLISSYDPINIPVYFQDPDWPFVNWIINHKTPGATPDQIQKAIWYFIDGGYAPYPGGDPVISGMIAGALANPDGILYQPGTGSYPNDQWIAVLVDAGASIQHTFIEVDP